MNILIQIISSLILFFIAGFTSQLESKQKVKDFVAPPPLIEHYSFGMRPQVADFIWVRTIQDFDYCEKYLVKRTCVGNSWLYHMLEAIVNLDPNYNVAYSAGGLALTILISDYEGASKIFDRGVEVFPNDWQLLFRAGYHALYEENNFVKAADLYRRAGENGGPEYCIPLSKRLGTKEGQIEVGERLVAQLIQREEEEGIINRLKEKIEGIRNQPR
jgi:tetratricopeptide (TPR) repeat protein